MSRIPTKWLVVATLLLTAGLPNRSLGQSTVPQQINHQGVLRVNGQLFDGTGLFRFAILDPDTGINRWTNDGTTQGAVGGTPTAAVSVTVNNGVYTVALGDASLANMTPIPSAIFNDNNLMLRIWFDDGVHGIQPLSPDQKLVSAPYAHSTANGVPVGTIVAFAGASSPPGWLLCDGAAVSRTTFANLFAVVLISWGQGDGTTTFNLPDLRGRFIRGVDNGAGRDPDVLTRTASNPGGNSGDAVGSLQLGATAMPNIPFTTQPSGSHSHSGNAGNVGGAGAARPLVGFTPAGATYNTNSAPNHTHGIIGGDSETRPVNVYVHYIIKF